MDESSTGAVPAVGPIRSIMIRCAKAGVDVPTGIATGANADLSRYESQAFTCPACNERHTWSGLDAFLER